MRADRLLSLLSLLQAYGRTSARRLADELEVSERTVYRDIGALSAAGVPVYTERGRNGGCALISGYRTDVSGLTTDEARALFTFTGNSTLADLGLEGDLRAALRKLLARLPEPQRPDALRARDSVVVDPHRWGGEAEDVPWLRVLQDAVHQGRRLTMAYRGSGTTVAVPRTVDPYGLVAKAGVWYLIAATDAQPKLYRVARVSDATIRPEPATRPPDLDLEALWESLRRKVEERPAGSAVSLRVKATEADRLLRICRAQLAGPAPAPAPAEDGWTTLDLTFVAEPAAAAMLAGFGPHVEVTAPDTLRTRLRDIGTALVARYG
ncbi:MAG TPA: WYL domain-containing protein [Pseudonocardiaceae bacterium]|jgi:predicted DNA-binding transcriptional regulator YafY|nr:WYL domain-containing protein [Pseudonocardiaceae bacterium]